MIPQAEDVRGLSAIFERQFGDGFLALFAHGVDSRTVLCAVFADEVPSYAQPLEIGKEAAFLFVASRNRIERELHEPRNVYVLKCLAYGESIKSCGDYDANLRRRATEILSKPRSLRDHQDVVVSVLDLADQVKRATSPTMAIALRGAYVCGIARLRLAELGEWVSNSSEALEILRVKDPASFRECERILGTEVLPSQERPKDESQRPNAPSRMRGDFVSRNVKHAIAAYTRV